MSVPASIRLKTSFRDPCGFVFRLENTVYRHIEPSYKENYGYLKSSGLFDELTGAGLLVGHEEMASPEKISPGAWKVIRPEKIPFISYAYEWCFSQLKEAALLLLEVQARALKKGMTLKDASASNVQFRGGRAVWIDTLSFEIDRNQPWIAYQQFCRHFIAPLALAVFRDARLIWSAELFPDGIPLDYASKLLPAHTWLDLHLLFHLHGNARTPMLSRENAKMETGHASMDTKGLFRILGHLKDAVEKLSWKSDRTAWSNYKPEEHYGMQGIEEKKAIVKDYLTTLRPEIVWDLGANTGIFSELAAGSAEFVLGLDSDASAVQKHWESIKQKKTEKILPLVVDLLQPTPGRGWENQERMSLVERGPADVVLVLGLLHHLSLGAGIPFKRAAEFLGCLCRHLIIEFVPPTDPKAREMAVRKENALHSRNYGPETFENDFSRVFSIKEKRPVAQTGRILYRMERRADDV